jgi:hypothetical protein
LIAFFDRIPYAIEQGKFSAEQGTDSTEQGIPIRHQRIAGNPRLAPRLCLRGSQQRENRQDKC